MVIGCGNPYAGDDSVGPELIRRLEARGDLECRFRFMPEGGLGILGLFEGADVVLFVDAVLGEGAPGTLHLIPMPSRNVSPRALGMVTSHGWGLAETLDLARALGRPIPRMMLLGIELEGLALGAPRSAAVERAIDLVVDRFPAVLALLTDPASRAWASPRRFPPDDESFPGA
jgi:hydrogenase maturation protease